MRFRVTALLAALSLWAQTPATPQVPPQFKTGIDVRRLDVVVLDREGRPVHGLTAADFTILEDGKPQKIATLDEIVVPEPERASTEWMRDVAPDVRTNNIPLDGRLMVIVIDDALNRDLEVIEPAKKIAREIVNRMGPSDLAAVVFSWANQHSQDFTADRTRLVAAIERLRPGAAATDPAVMDPALGEFNFRQASIATVAKASEYLRAIEGRRKALFYISVGVPVDWEDIARPITNLGDEGVIVGGKLAMTDVGEAMRGLLAEAQLANVAVYALSPAGLTVDDTRLQQDFLRSVAENTGGVAVVNTNAPEARVADIFTATSAYYLLAYDIQKPDDGKYRRIEVRVNRPGATVQARRGFYAGRPKKPVAATTDAASKVSPLATAMAGFLPKGDVPMRAIALPFALAGGKPEAAVAIVARIQQPRVDKRTTQQVDLLTSAFDSNGAPKGSRRQTARVTMLPSDTEIAEYEVLSQIDLKPGRYNLRIAAHNTATDKSGSVFYDLDVPDFRTDGLWMSGAALSVKPGLLAAPRGALSALLPVVPTTIREFVADDEVHGFVQIVQGGKRTPANVNLEIRIADARDRTVHRASDTLESSMFPATRFAEYRFAIPVEALAPGSYLLTIAVDAAGRSARRDVRFTRR
jgi:VWFA-related protein